MKKLCINTFVLTSLCASFVDAAVFERDWKVPGDGLLTYDDVSKREWLDLSVSRLDQFSAPRLENAIAEIAPGGLFEGFTFAKRHDVVAFAESAGVDTSTSNFAVNETATDQLIDLLGITFQSSTTTRSIGFINETRSTSQVGADFFVSFKPLSGAGSIAGLLVSSSDDLLGTPANGLMLYRSVPEPSPISSAVTLMLVWFSRQRQGVVS